MQSNEDARLRVIDLPVVAMRKMEDPYNKGCSIVDALVDTREWVKIPNDPNARDPESGKDREVYKAVRRSLMDGKDLDHPEKSDACTPTAFLYKCQGMHIVAAATDYVKKEGPDARDILRLFLREGDDENVGDGLVNGGHVQDAIEEQQQKHGKDMPRNLVKVVVSVGLPPTVIPEVSRGNNSSIQVRPESIVNLEKKFAPFKEALVGTRLEGRVDWGTGVASRDELGAIDKGELDAPMVLAMVYGLLPSKTPPINAYAYRTGIVYDFAKNSDRFYKAIPILQDGFRLMDLIRTTAGKHYSGKYGALKCVQTITRDTGGKARKPRPPFVMPFTGELVEQRLGLEAAFGIYGAFRCFVVEGADGNYRWATSFDDVLKAWDAVSAECVAAAQKVLSDNGYNLNALGKSRTYWPFVDGIVGMERLRQASQKPLVA